jgi:hypothetical protein
MKSEYIEGPEALRGGASVCATELIFLATHFF